MSQRRKPEFRFTPSFGCYSFESCCHDWRFFSLHRRPNPPFGWSSCFPRTIQLPLPASPCSRLSRPRSTIRQSDFCQVFGSSSLYQLVRPYKLNLNLTDLPWFPWNPSIACAEISRTQSTFQPRRAFRRCIDPEALWLLRSLVADPFLFANPERRYQA